MDFKLRQEKTFANKLARYLTKLRNLGRLGYAVGDLVIFGYCFFLKKSLYLLEHRGAKGVHVVEKRPLHSVRLIISRPPSSVLARGNFASAALHRWTCASILV